MRRTFILISSVAAVSLLGFAVVDAQRARPGAMGRQATVGPRGVQGARVGPAIGRGQAMVPGGRGPGAFGGLDLSDAQREAIRNLQRTTRDQSAPLADELRTARRALDRAILADERDDAAVEGLAAKVSALGQQLAGIQLSAELTRADVLTAEQRLTLRTRGGRGGRDGRGGRGGRGAPGGLGRPGGPGQ